MTSDARLETPSERIVRMWREGPLEAMPPSILLETAQRQQRQLAQMRDDLARWRDWACDVMGYVPVTASQPGLDALKEQARALLAGETADGDASQTSQASAPKPDDWIERTPDQLNIASPNAHKE